MRSVWVICYIDASKVESIVKDLRKKAIYSCITAYVPTVKILQKNRKNKEFFEMVPLLFNYGFLKMPIPFACDERFLSKLKEDVQCIFGWVKDPAKVINNKPKIKPNGQSVFDISNVPFGVATERDIANMIISEETQSIYSQLDLANLNIGSIITLKGYPFDNIQAEIVAVNSEKKQVKVKLLLEGLLKQVTVSFDNIFYTVYRAHDSDKPMRESYTEDRFGDNKLYLDFLINSNE